MARILASWHNIIHIEAREKVTSPLLLYVVRILACSLKVALVNTCSFTVCGMEGVESPVETAGQTHRDIYCSGVCVCAYVRNNLFRSISWWKQTNHIGSRTPRVCVFVFFSSDPRPYLIITYVRVTEVLSSATLTIIPPTLVYMSGVYGIIQSDVFTNQV
jgi:hypothetical protein